jgi:PhnB protein
MTSSTLPAPEEKKVNPIPKGYKSLTPYITALKAEELIEFVKQAFGAVERLRTTAPGGNIHAEVKILDSVLMMGGGSEMRGSPMPTALHLYVPDADTVYQRALAAGATSLHGPKDQPYGDHEASVKDAFGNHWYIATPLNGSTPPAGLRAVTPYLHPTGAPELIDFLKAAFEAKEVDRHASPEGSIAHAKIQIGDSILEMSEAHGDAQPMPTMFYYYVEDCGAVYERAIKAGATSIEAPAEQAYGDRRAAVMDAWGNLWFMATHVKDVSLT